MICERLRVPYSAARCVEELTDADRYAATVMAEAEQLLREAKEKER
jgi:hypothetical protein